MHALRIFFGIKNVGVNPCGKLKWAMRMINLYCEKISDDVNAEDNTEWMTNDEVK